MNEVKWSEGEVNEFKYFGTILCKHGSMEGEIRERTVQGRQVMGALEEKRKRKLRKKKERRIRMRRKRGISTRC